MEKGFWQQRWDGGQIGFHLRDVNPRLLANIATLGDGGRVLVPLCGKTLDMSFLASSGFEVVGIEFVDEAAQSYFADAGVVPTRLQKDGFSGYQHQNVTIWVADIFAITSQVLGGPMDAIYDRAALVALAPDTRTSYVQQLLRFSRSGTRLLLVSFEHDTGTGPPFSLEDVVVTGLLADTFDVTLVERVDTLEAGRSFKERGATRLAEAVWAGQRP